MDIPEHAYDFSVRVAELVRYLREGEARFPLDERLLYCGVMAGLATRQKNKAKAAECVEEADYIIEMAGKSGYLTNRQAGPIRSAAKNLLDELR